MSVLRVRRKAKLLLFLVAMIAALAALEACGGGNNGTATVLSVTISAQETNVPLNDSTDITAVVKLSNNTTNTSTAVTFILTPSGSSGFGSITPSPINPQVGVYMAPAKAPGANNNEVTITATAPVDPSNANDTAVVTSNMITIIIGSGVGLAVTPGSQTCVAGTTVCQFAATLNSENDPAARWSVTQVPGVDVGTIDPLSGLYTAPPTPPPGGMVTITATDPAANPSTATATATIVYGDGSFKGPFAFSIVGGSGANFEAVSGSFVADGAGNIQSGGIEDVNSAALGVHVQVPIQGGNYLVRSDGRVKATINTGLVAQGSNITTLEFALVSNKHAVVIRFDTNATASGTIDQQNLDALTGSPSLIQGPLVFSVAGFDANFKPMGIAGEFSANSAGMIPQTNTVVDMNDNGTITTLDRSLAGASPVSYSFDAANPGTGRGTLTLTSTSTGQIEYAFYIVDTTPPPTNPPTTPAAITHLKLVEIEHIEEPSGTSQNEFLSGDVLQGFAPNLNPGTDLAAGNYVFTSVGTSSNEPYASGGVFTSDGSANITGGAFDVNNAGTVPASATLGTCAYSVDASTGRIDLKLFSGAGVCPAAPAASVAEFAMYQTAAFVSSSGLPRSQAVMLELDAAAVSSGVAYKQQAATALPAGSFALELVTRGVGQNAPGSIEQDATGQVTLSGANVTGGNLDINAFNATFANNPISTTGTTITAPAQNGRGTAVLNATDPTITFNLNYYIIDNQTALFFDTDTTRVGSGIIAQQF